MKKLLIFLPVYLLSANVMAFCVSNKTDNSLEGWYNTQQTKIHYLMSAKEERCYMINNAKSTEQATYSVHLTSHGWIYNSKTKLNFKNTSNANIEFTQKDGLILHSIK
jgi:hypothetical protein